jgi:hypothetical protein
VTFDEKGKTSAKNLMVINKQDPNLHLSTSSTVLTQLKQPLMKKALPDVRGDSSFDKIV